MSVKGKRFDASKDEIIKTRTVWTTDKVKFIRKTFEFSVSKDGEFAKSSHKLIITLKHLFSIRFKKVTHVKRRGNK